MYPFLLLACGRQQKTGRLVFELAGVFVLPGYR
jgi:hypothetical protein